MKDEALRLALEDLKSVLCDPRGRCCINGSDADRLVVDRSLAAIKQALANDALDKMAENERELGIQMQPEPEPVAWTDLLKEAQEIVESKFVWKRFIDGTPLANDIACWMADFAQQHTSPPKRKPLTDEEIMDIAMNKPFNSAIGFARAIEAAHGIKE